MLLRAVWRPVGQIVPPLQRIGRSNGTLARET
jgi:hypothetical protein